MSTSIVLELQRLASDSQKPLADLLRKALIVATKLKLDDLRTWLLAELNGYDGKTELPEYRTLSCRLTALTRHGEIPLGFQNDAELQRLFTSVPIFGGIAELEQMAQQSGLLYPTMPIEQIQMLYQLAGNNQFIPQRATSPAAVRGIIDTVRNAVLDWSLKLEQQGILGDGMSFSDAEKQKASNSSNIHIGSIGSFTGNLGSVSAENIQIGDYSAINKQLKDAGISQAERNELENLMDELKTATPEEKPSLIQNGMDWVGRNAKNLGAMATAIRAYFQP